MEVFKASFFIFLGCVFHNCILVRGNLAQEEIPNEIQIFPHPGVDPSKCRTTLTHRLCDPDSILSEADVQTVENALDELKPTIMTVDDSRCVGRTGDHHSDVEVQFAVAITDKMNKWVIPGADGGDGYTTNSAKDPKQTAEKMGRLIHDAWGVGENTKCGDGTGILVFLSIEDRALYISRGSALDKVLTDHRLDLAIQKMRPLLKERRYGAALVQGLHELHSYIIRSQASSVSTFIKYMKENSAQLAVHGGLCAWFGYHFARKRSMKQDQFSLIGDDTNGNGHIAPDSSPPPNAPQNTMSTLSGMPTRKSAGGFSIGFRPFDLLQTSKPQSTITNVNIFEQQTRDASYDNTAQRSLPNSPEMLQQKIESKPTAYRNKDGIMEYFHNRREERERQIWASKNDEGTTEKKDNDTSTWTTSEPLPTDESQQDKPTKNQENKSSRNKNKWLSESHTSRRSRRMDWDSDFGGSSSSGGRAGGW